MNNQRSAYRIAAVLLFICLLLLPVFVLEYEYGKGPDANVTYYPLWLGFSSLINGVQGLFFLKVEFFRDSYFTFWMILALFSTLLFFASTFPIMLLISKYKTNKLVPHYMKLNPFSRILLFILIQFMQLSLIAVLLSPDIYMPREDYMISIPITGQIYIFVLMAILLICSYKLIRYKAH